MAAAGVLLAVALVSASASAMPGDISTYAGNGTAGFSGNGGPATSASLYYPDGVALDSSGNLYIADTWNNRVRKVSTSGTISTVAGNGTAGFSGDGGPATSASLRYPDGIALDSSGNLYIADTSNMRVRKVSTSGTISTVAGNDTEPGFSGDGGPATSASLSYPRGVALDFSGNLHIADTDNERVRKVSTSGTISTVAGSGTAGFSGDGGPAASASLNDPYGVALDSSGNLYIADTYNHRIRKVDAGVAKAIISARNVSQDSPEGDSVRANPGDIVEYRITHANSRTGDGHNVIVSDEVPDESTFVSCEGGCTTSGAGPGASITWHLGTLPPGSSSVLTFQTQLALTFTNGSIENQASVTADEYSVESNVAIVSAAVAPPPGPNPTERALFFALGDSIVAGHGLRPYESDPGTLPYACKRSYDSFAYQLSDILSNQGFTDSWPRTTFGNTKHAACTGYTTGQIANVSFEVPYVVNAIKNSGRDAYVVIDGGINDFDFASGTTGQHMFCDSKDEFQAWVDGVIGGVSYTMARRGDPAAFSNSVLGRLLDAGNTRTVVTGYYNPIGQNDNHPVILLWDFARSGCVRDTGKVRHRVGWVIDRLNRELQADVGFANQQRPGLGFDRARFVQPADTFAGHVQCQTPSFVQNFAESDVLGDLWKDGSDCVHPSQQGAQVIANIAYVGFTENFDQCPPGVSDGAVVTCGKYHVQGDPMQLNE
jgi:uncharacterized repeat protein (TIGR01451 family)